MTKKQDSPVVDAIGRRTFLVGTGAVAVHLVACGGPSPEEDAGPTPPRPDAGPPVVADDAGVQPTPPMRLADFWHQPLSAPPRSEGRAYRDGNVLVTRSATSEGDVVTRWVACDFSVQLTVTSSERSLALSSPLGTTASVTGDAFELGAMHNDVRARMGDSVLYEILRELRQPVA
ncbi:MAG: hypothetical protein AB7S26_31485 [Sandaracinaceae bacterium]